MGFFDTDAAGEHWCSANSKHYGCYVGWLASNESGFLRWVINTAGGATERDKQIAQDALTKEQASKWTGPKICPESNADRPDEEVIGEILQRLGIKTDSG